MPKSRKSKRGKTAKKDNRSTPKRAVSPIRAVFMAGLVVVAGVGGWFWYESGLAEDAFLDHAERGRQNLAAKVERPQNQGTGHVEPGQGVRYLGDPPTSGPHDPTWVEPGFYDAPQRPERLVHSLEHGMIVIYYDRPDPTALATLKDWAELYGAPWSGLVLAPKPGLGEAIVLTAWVRLLRLEPFDADAAAAFIDEYRGRGPEHPVR